MIDHVSIRVGDFEKSKAFYKAALIPLGYELDMEYPDACGFHKGKHSVWLIKESYVTTGAHIAFVADSKEVMEEFHKAALEAGGEDNGAPGPRPDYGEDYHGAFIIDPDGNNIEAVWRENDIDESAN